MEDWAGLDSLILKLIFEHLDFYTKRVVLQLCCRSWHAVCAQHPELYGDLVLDWARECTPASAVYPDHVNAPRLDFHAVCSWVQRRLPALHEPTLALRRGRTFDEIMHAGNMDSVALPNDVGAMLGMLAGGLHSLEVVDCTSRVCNATLGTLWCLTALRRLVITDIRISIQISSFGSVVRHLRALEHLELACVANGPLGDAAYGLEELPDTLSCLMQLRVLRLRWHRRIRRLPESLAALQSLSELSLRDCGRAGGPEGLPMGAGLARLPSLQKLDLTNSSFAYNFDAALPGERLFPALQELGLSNSCGLQHRLRPLVPLLHACAGLTSLDLRRNDIICSADDLYRQLNYDLASSMAGMEDLKELDLSNNKVRTLGHILGAATALTSLNLSNNEFGSPKVRSEQLPSNIGAASQRLPPLPSLRWLDLSNNELRHLAPSVLYNCRALRHLGLANNKLDHLPDDLADRLPHLTSVELGNNDLKKVPAALAQLSTLQHLDVSRNSIYLGPEMELLCAMPALCRLVLGRQSSPITQEAKAVVEQLRATGLEVI